MRRTLVVTMAMLAAAAYEISGSAQQAARAATPLSIDLAGQLAAGKLRVVNREAANLADDRPAVRLSAAPGNGVAWIEGTDFAEGTIELDVRGKDVLQQSFLGLAFHCKDDETYDAVYLRPFNFRATDPARREHALQYVSVPAYDWPRLREQFPEVFENPVDASVLPTDWVPLRVVVKAQAIHVYVGDASSPALEVMKLGEQARGQVGPWVGNNSDGDFANLRITPAPSAVGVAVPASALEKYAGMYALTGDLPPDAKALRFRLFVEGGRLMAQVDGQQVFPMTAESDVRFSIPMVGAQFEFQKDNQGRATGFALNQAGLVLNAARVER